MNINFNYISNYTTSFLKESLFIPLQQKKILAVAFVALTCLGACYALGKYCFNVKPKVDEKSPLRDELGHLLNGKRKIVFRDGTRWDGEWKDGFLHGQGQKIYADGRVRKGEFLKGKLNGHGKVNWPNGVELDGEFINDFFIEKDI
jgi:hypothetical protein